MTPRGEAPLLEVTDLVKHFPIKRGILIDREVDQVRAVDGISFTVDTRRDAGPGRRVRQRQVDRLPGGAAADQADLGLGQVRGRGDRRPLRGGRCGRCGGEMQMIFQDPYASLNPRKRVGQIVGDPLKRQGVASGVGAAAPGAGAAGAGRALQRALQPLPARVLRRPAAADRDRPGDRPEAEAGRSPTSRSPPSTSRSRRRSSTCSTTSRTSSASPTSSSPTTSASSATSPTGSR